MQLLKIPKRTPEQIKARREARKARSVSKVTHALTPRPKRRKIVVTVYPAGYIELRPFRCRTGETVDIEAAYARAVKERVAAERAARKGRK